MVYVVCPDHLAGEFVHQVIFFVQTLGGSKNAHAIWPVDITRLAKLSSSNLQGGIPVDIHPVPLRIGDWGLGFGAALQQIAADAGPGQAIGVVNEVIAIASLHTKRHAIDRRIWIGCHADDAPIFYIQVELATDTAVGTGGSDFPFGSGEGK